MGIINSPPMKSRFFFLALHLSGMNFIWRFTTFTSASELHAVLPSQLSSFLPLLPNTRLTFRSHQAVWEHADQNRHNSTDPCSPLAPCFPSLCLPSHSKTLGGLSSTISFAKAALILSTLKLLAQLFTFFFFLILKIGLELYDILLNYF